MGQTIFVELFWLQGLLDVVLSEWIEICHKKFPKSSQDIFNDTVLPNPKIILLYQTYSLVSKSLKWFEPKGGF